MPTNMYGPNDNYDPVNSHVIPGLIRRFHEARIKGDGEVVVWGTGTPRREFLYVDDLADASIFLMNNYSGNETVNVGSGIEVTIKELADGIKDAVGFNGDVVFDPFFWGLTGFKVSWIKKFASFSSMIPVSCFPKQDNLAQIR